MAYSVDITGSNITIVCIYGWTGGHQDTEAFARTDDLFAIIRAELALQPLGHKIITGDINGEPKDFPNLLEMLEEEQIQEHRQIYGDAYHRNLHATLQRRRSKHGGTTSSSIAYSSQQSRESESSTTARTRPTTHCR